MPWDLRFVVRSLGRQPAFVLATTLTLSLAIAATVTVFSVVNALLLRDLPYRDPGGLTAVWPDQFLANREIEALRGRAHSF